MILRLLPGVDGADVQAVLDQMQLQATNIRGSGANPETLLRQYLGWARTAADRSARLLAPEDVRQLFLTDTYWALLAIPPTLCGAVYETAQAELQARAAQLQEAAIELAAERERWSSGFGPIVVLDTGTFIEHRLEFPACLSAIEDEIAPVAGSTGFTAGTPVQFVVPLQVIDELDKTKSDRARGRARVALARLNEVVSSPLERITLEGLRAGSALHLLPDDPRHERLPIADDEIVARALYLKGMGRATAVATFDTGMDLRARFVGLESFLLADRRA